jgi:hypothetical protein
MTLLDSGASPGFVSQFIQFEETGDQWPMPSRSAVLSLLLARMHSVHHELFAQHPRYVDRSHQRGHSTVTTAKYCASEP